MVRPPCREDAVKMWRFVEESATLDHNSQYLYLLLADMFSQTSAVAVQNGRIVGLVTAFLVPQRADTLFVYQMRVGVQVRHHKLALTMIDSILARFPDDVRFVEATVHPENVAAHAVLSALARSRDTVVVREPFVRAQDFVIGPISLGDEDRLTVGPFNVS